jgi:uncharacterized phage protein (TIGR01671 family)|uniref:YopX protein n=1 Tax=Siphoviridae sp. ctES717 TaxID=2827564 RepID=A0A8S5RRT7_9CAUD|nr:MAG TPA: YopX protein [Siphoviridae sp. ctES717]
MNREIKFRAWHKVKNIMVYDNEDDTYGYWDGCRNSNVGMVNEILNSKYYEEYEFMQFTGLHDKNGKEIYEGDIVKKTGSIGIDIGKVIYEYNGFIVDVMNMDRFYGRVHLLEKFTEVIGNIYEDSELLGGE